MKSWEFISTNFIDHYYIRMLFRMKRFPLIGYFARRALFRQLSFIYDVVSTYLLAHEKVDHMAKSFPIQEDLMNVIFSESHQNRTMAEDYLNNYLGLSFPEITRSIQSIKASHNILTRKKGLIYTTVNPKY